LTPALFTSTSRCPHSDETRATAASTSNFFERRVFAYQMGVTGEVAFDADF